MSYTDLCATSRSFGHLAVVKSGLRITRVLWIHCSLGCLPVAREFLSRINPLPVDLCVDLGFGSLLMLSLTYFSAVCTGVLYSGYYAEFVLSLVCFSYEL